MAYQSLYRRYRPQKFSEMRGQAHVVRALRNAVRDDRVGHAYLLSGPRGTGKTTAARILAKVLNCTNPSEGEPCGECESCRSIEAGTSFDLHELDAASNNKVDDVRDLLSKVALGTPGRTKVYLLDEVHMLTAGAENALLKTLEEPPDHVVFVLATTEPHKVVPTIRSRTQQLELTLIGAEEMTDLVREVAVDAELDIDDEVIRQVVRIGGGSARDTLSALDQAVAAGGVGDTDTSTPDLLAALVEQDPGLALRAIESATQRGVDARRIGERFIDALRTVFLVKMGSAPDRLSEPERELADQHAPALTAATITRALEMVGRALVDMRQAPDPRIDLEVTLVRITKPEAGDTGAMAARLDALEVQMSALAAGGGVVPAEPTEIEPAPPVAGDPVSAAPTETPPAPTTSGAQKARAALRPRASAPPPPPSMAPPPAQVSDEASTPAEVELESEPPSEPPPAPTPATAAPDGPVPSPVPASIELDDLRTLFRELLDGLSTAARARFLAGSVEGFDDDRVRFVLPNEAQRQRCEKFSAEVEAALSTELGRAVSIELTVEASDSSSSPGPTTAEVEPDDEVDLGELTDANASAESVVERINDVFPGAEVLTTPES